MKINFIIDIMYWILISIYNLDEIENGISYNGTYLVKPKVEKTLKTYQEGINGHHVRFHLTETSTKNGELGDEKRIQRQLILSRQTEEYLKEKEVIETSFSNIFIICPKNKT